MELTTSFKFDGTFDAYQRLTESTAVYKQSIERIADRLAAPGMQDELAELLRWMYVGMGAGDEAGECLGKLKKLLRDADGIATPDFIVTLSKECGDVIWYLARICSEFGLSLGQVAQNNMCKLMDRKERGVLSGSGDNR